MVGIDAFQAAAHHLRSIAAQLATELPDHTRGYDAWCEPDLLAVFNRIRTLHGSSEGRAAEVRSTGYAERPLADLPRVAFSFPAARGGTTR